MKSRYIPAAAFAVAALLVLLCGCGGGSGSSATDRSGSISGSVYLQRSAVGAPPGAEAIQVSVDGSAASTTAAPDGSFTLTGVPEGYQTIVARTSRRAMAVAARVMAGRDTDVGDLVLAEAGQISGIVTSSADRRPVAGARVTVNPAVTTNTADVGPLPVRRTATDAAGSYTVPGLAAGYYVVTVEKRGFESGSLLLEVKPTTTTVGDVTLDPSPTAGSGSLEGAVTTVSESGVITPLAGALVRLGPVDDPIDILPVPDRVRDGSGGETTVGGGPPVGPGPCWFAFTDENGAYAIDGVPAGSYRAIAIRAGFEPSMQNVTISASGATRLDFVLSAHVAQVGTVTGVVTDKATGAPIAGAIVAVRFMPPPPPTDGEPGSSGSSSGGWAGMGDFDMTATTDASGAYTLRAPAGDLVLWVQANGYLLYDQPLVVAAGTTVRADVALVAASTETFVLKGVVVGKTADGTLAPVSGAHVIAGLVNDPSMSPERPTAGYQTRTGADGTFSFRVGPGEYYVMALKGNLVSMPTAVTVTGDTTVRLVLEEMVGMGGGTGGSGGGPR